MDHRDRVTMEIEDIYVLASTMENASVKAVEALPGLRRRQRDHLLNQHLEHRVTETLRAARALRQECETVLFGDEVKRLAHLRAIAEERRDRPQVRPGCPKCKGQPQDFRIGPTEFHPDAKPCCNTQCKGEWGTGCYHCHDPRFYPTTPPGWGHI